MRVVTRKGPLPFRDIDLGDLLRPNVIEAARKGAALPFRTLAAASAHAASGPRCR